MKIAIDFYARGKQKEVDADEYDRTRYYSKDRFICPECGEPVHLTSGKKRNHFAHFKKNEMSAECDRRVDGVPTESIYERIGLPIYLRKNSSDDFELYMGFKALPSVLMNSAIRDSVSIKIDGKATYKINKERFSCEVTSLIPIDYIPLSDMKYSIVYEPVNKAYAISQHWSDYADGFSYEGALFLKNEQGGKKVRHGDSVTTDREYYWIRRQTQLPSFLPGIDSKRCGKVILKGNTLNVFCVTFNSNISDAEYNHLTRFLRYELKINLLEKQPEFVPIWPPMIKTEEGYVTSESTRNIYGHIVSGNEIPRVYSYQGIQKMPDEIHIDSKFATVILRDQYTLVNVDRKYVANGTLFVKKNRCITSFGNNIFEVIASEKIRIHEVPTIQDSDKVVFNSEQQADFILVRNSGLIEKSTRIGEIAFGSLKDGDQIFVVCNRNLVGYIRIEVNRADESALEVWDERIHHIITELHPNARRVKMPDGLRLKLCDSKEKMPLSRERINSMMKVNMIPLPLVKILEEMLDE